MSDWSENPSPVPCLAAFQQAGVKVPYRMATPVEAAGRNFSTTNQGASVRVRGQQ